MVGRLYRTLNCTEYLEGKRHPAPALKLTLYNVIGEKILENLKVPIDTGYEGSIMLTTKLYQVFQIAELPRILWRNYRTLTGAITMRIARAIIEIDDIKFECFVESPLFGKGKTPHRTRTVKQTNNNNGWRKKTSMHRQIGSIQQSLRKIHNLMG